MAVIHSNHVNVQVGKQLTASTHCTEYNGAEQRKMKVQIIIMVLSEQPHNDKFHSGRRDIVRTACLRRIRYHKYNL